MNKLTVSHCDTTEKLSTSYPHSSNMWGMYRTLRSMHMIKIYDTDTVWEIAKKIWEDFDVLASCTVYGFVEVEKSLVPKGQLVVSELRKMDELENVKKNAVGSKVRQWKYKKDSIGGPIAHKIFTWEKRIVDDEPRFTIWRVQ